MPITISGSTGIAGVDGSASTPAVQGTDTNTGIFFPAADTIAFGEGGSEAMRIDSSGNVGIGTSSPGNKLDIVSAGSSQIRVKDGVNATAYYDFGRDGTDGFFGFSGAQTTFSGYKWSVSAGTEVMRITNGGNLQFNSGYGSVATAYGCRAWVNFNGTGTVAIRASGNVTSITDNGTGEYTVNLTTALTDANYSVVGSCGTGAAGNDDFNLTTNYNAAPTTSAVRIGSQRANSGVATDAAYISLAIFR
jgi:hypothetical protein